MTWGRGEPGWLVCTAGGNLKMKRFLGHFEANIENVGEAIALLAPSEITVLMRFTWQNGV